MGLDRATPNGRRGRLDRRQFLWASGGSVIAGLSFAEWLAACGGNTSGASGGGSGRPVKGGQAIIAIQGDPSYLNPDPISNVPEQLIGYGIYEGLVRVKPDGSIAPLLAKSWSISPDGLTYSFHLQDATWSDGKALTSTDVKYTLMTMGPIAAAFSATSKVIDQVDDSDPKTAVVKLKHSFGPFLGTLTSHGAGILPAHVFEGSDPLKNPASLTQPVGTGPFVLKEWVRGDHITLSRNPKYWASGQPYLDEVVFKVIPDAAAMVTALEAGDIDYVHNQYLNPSQWATVKSRPSLTLTPSQAPPGDAVLFFNVHRDPYSNEAVRQALFRSIDRNYLKKAVFNDAGEPGKGPIDSRLAWAYNPAVDFDKMYPYDVQKAKADLDAVGFKVGAGGTRFAMQFVIPETSGPIFEQGQALAQMFKAVGVDVKMQAIPQTVANSQLAKRDFDTTITQLTTNGDPELGVARFYVSSAIGKAYSNYGAYSNPEVDKLFAEGAAASDKAQRAKFYFQVETILAKALPAIPYYEYLFYNGQSKKLQGIEESQFYPNWSLVYMEK